MIAHVLSIAGSDPSGGAGIQADLKTFSALGAYGMSVITALTAQNTRGVTGVFELPHDFVGAQIESIFSDIRVDAVKIGMAGNPDTIKIIATALRTHKPKHIVLDPVMVAQSGDRLLTDDALKVLKGELLPLASIITPNIPEAEVLLGHKITDMEAAVKSLLMLGVKSVFLKGGHGSGENSNDVFGDANTLITLEQKRIDTTNNHGTGCTLSSALATYLAKGLSLPKAAESAKDYITQALKNADKLDVGGGHGPVHHFHAQWSS